MYRQIRANLTGQPRHAVILHDDGVHATFGQVDQLPLGVAQFPVKDQHIEGDKALHAPLVQIAHDIGQFGGIEADFGTGMEAGTCPLYRVDSEKYSVCSGLYSGTQLGPATHGTHHFGFHSRAEKNWLRRHNASV